MLMRDVKLNNPELMELLNDLAADIGDMITNHEELLIKDLQEKLYKNSPKGRAAAGKSQIWKSSPHMDILPELCTEVGNLYDPVGREYLDLMIDIAEKQKPLHDASEYCGWPNKEIFLSLIDLRANQILRDKYSIDKKADNITYGWLNGNSRALFGLYPPGGYIPWHNNGNAPGYNILMHYNWGGDGSFYSLHDNEIIEYADPDKKWVARAGQFLSTGAGMVGDEVKQVPQRDASWHAASTRTWRLTVSTIINNFDVWEDVIDEMETAEL
jgi:hypothetical protein